MRNECKVLSYDLSSAYTGEIESEVEKYCNESFLTYKTVKTCTSAYCNDRYVVNIIYEYKFKWLKFLFILALIAFAVWIFITLFN